MNVPSAALSSDEEFLRRVTLDLTGRIPAAADVRAFVADQNPGKRSAMIDHLLFTPEFADKWTMWLGDLVENNATALNVNRNITARNSFYKFLWDNVTDASVSLQDTAYQNHYGQRKHLRRARRACLHPGRHRARRPRR